MTTDELEIIITVDWLEDWLKRVSKRLVFFSYKGGCGGEYIVNTVQESFYSTSLHPNKWGEINTANNRSQAIDHLFNNFFVSWDHEDDSIANFNDLARELLEYYSNTSLLCLRNIYHFDMIEEYAIVRMHYVPKFMELFEDSVKISLTPGSYQWGEYTYIAQFLKVNWEIMFCNIPTKSIKQTNFNDLYEYEETKYHHDVHLELISSAFHVHGFEDNKYTMDDVMNGKILESFSKNVNLDITKSMFTNSMKDWFNNNVEFYKQIGFTEPPRWLE